MGLEAVVNGIGNVCKNAGVVFTQRFRNIYIERERNVKVNFG